MQKVLGKVLQKSEDRVQFCIELVNELSLRNIAEIGVYRGDFAKEVLEKSQSIDKYTMVDPWRNLTHWNKPWNKDNDTFDGYYQETLDKTDFAKEKRHVLRGKTTEVIDQIEDNFYDLAYIDGDHTLKGITIDLINLWPKVKEDGFILGDDFSPTIWQHSDKYEPTMIFPFAVYFAEAVNAKIYGLPFNQFLIAKGQTGFQFIDLTNGDYANLDLNAQLLVRSKHPRTSGLRRFIKKNVPFASKIYNAIKK